ncbi:MAG: lysylphosphatidylglycerol synthase transmembrane domain-containing protein [Hyphomicrobiales bacterium]
MRSWRHGLKLIIGLAIGIVFFYLAVRNVNIDQMLAALGQTRYGFVLLSALLMFASHYLRALRWGYFLAPVKRVPAASLFSALMIGYAANTFVPAHLGEFLRAFVIGKKQDISASAALASIVVERIVDVVSLIAVMALVIMVHPFPEWVEVSGAIMLGGALLAIGVLIAAKRHEHRTVALMHALTRPLPERIGRRLEALSANFLAGLLPLRSAGHYLAASVLSLAIWLGYAATYYTCLEAFNLVSVHHLAWYVGLVVLVFTTISVVIPSTPGYVGTYHYLCQLSLVMFGVSASEALSFAVIAHFVNVAPVAVAGLICANYEGVAIYRTASEVRRPEAAN